MPWNRDEMAARAARELQDGFYVNLGIGIPTLVANHVPEGLTVTLQSENGCWASARSPEGEKTPTSSTPASRPSANCRIRLFRQRRQLRHDPRRHIDLTVLGAMEVSENGDIANWMIPGKMIKGMGGAMDLVAGVKKIIVVMEHNAKDGSPKFIPACTLPLTGRNVVDMIVTDLAVFQRPDHASPSSWWNWPPA
jgi:3-oxoacid CoA-transferase B subunit